MTLRRPSFETRPIDDTARDGTFQVVSADGFYFAIVRWIDGAWFYSTGRRLDYEPTVYRHG